MRTFAWIFILSCIVYGCNTNDRKKEDESMIVANDSIVDSVSTDRNLPDSVPANIQVDSVIQLFFGPGNSSISVKGHLKKSGEPVICLISVVQGKELSASVVPENNKATVRFSHIYLPDGRSDGPFGSNIKYKLEQQGVYKLYIGPNKMAGDPGSTDFMLNVRVE